MAGFDPDAYLSGAGGGFDPDAYLGQATGKGPAGPMSWGDVGSQAVSNLGPSAVGAAKSLAQPFLHPLDTMGTMADLAGGAMQKAGLVSGTEGIPQVDAVGQFYKDRFGGMENIKHTLATDPVGAAMDLSTVLSGGETALARAPGVIGKVGEVAGTVGRAVDPLANAAKVIKPSLGVSQQALADTGVLMTPGQMAGGYFKSLEDAGTSVPILGDFINSGRAKSIESFNKATANQALAPIGESLSRTTKAGHETVDEVATKLGVAYDALLPKLQYVPDAQYAQDFNRIVARDVSILPKQYADQFHAIIGSRMGPPAPMNGTMFKSVEGELTYIANNYRSSADGAQRGLAGAIDNTINAMRQNLERSNPAHAQELADINSGWAMYSRIRGAAARRATSEGVFTPSDLLAAIKSGDKSVGKGSFARGDALMQTYAEAGQKVLPSKLPDSGTAKRLATIGVGAGAAWLAHNPLIAAAGAGAITPYTRPGMWLANKYAAPTTGPRAAFRSLASGPAGKATFQVGRAAQPAPYGAAPNPYQP